MRRNSDPSTPVNATAPIAMPAIAAAAAAQAAPDAPQRVAAAADGLDPNPHVMAESGPELADGVGDDGAAGGRHMAPDRLALRLEAEP